MPDRLRSLPSVDRVLDAPELEDACRAWSHRALLAAVRSEIARARARVEQGGAEAPDAAAVAAAVSARLARLGAPSPAPVVNATGVVVHTNLGRAPLAPAALEAAAGAASRYADLEIDVGTGRRGDRQAAVAGLLGLMFPGASSLVVNNNAAAVMLVLNTLARGRDVVISRGELVEIGGSFRVPEILERAGARLVEVGTTNRTHAADYRGALSGETGLILRVWPSNYRVVGFTKSVPLAELAAIARDADVPLVVDQGCGRPFPDAPGPANETPVEALLADGADLVTCSGDKMLGGPQSGLVVGAPDAVARCARNPMARALRPGKLTLAALASTLRAWLSADGPGATLPVPAMLSAAPAQLARRAASLAARIGEVLPHARVTTAGGASRVGGGAAPGEDLPTTVVRVEIPGLPEAELAARLRQGAVPVIVRVTEGAVTIDPRTLDPVEEPPLLEALVRAGAP